MNNERVGQRLHSKSCTDSHRIAGLCRLSSPVSNATPAAGSPADLTNLAASFTDLPTDLANCSTNSAADFPANLAHFTAGYAADLTTDLIDLTVGHADATSHDQSSTGTLHFPVRPVETRPATSGNQFGHCFLAANGQWVAGMGLHGRSGRHQ